MTVDCLYVNGDSWAYGAKLNEETRLTQCWASLVAKALGLELILGAYEGASNHRIIRTSVVDIQKLVNAGRRPLVLICWTFPHRYELCELETNNWVRFSGTGYDANPELADMIAGKYNSDVGNTEVFATQALLMQSFLKNNNLPYLFVPTFRIALELLPPDMLATLRDATDLRYFMHDFNLRSYLNSFNDLDWIKDHPGPEGHSLLADFLLTQINRRQLCTQ